MNKQRVRVNFYTSNKAFMDAPISSLDISQRAVNCLMRGNFGTVGTLVNSIDRKEDLYKLHNCGQITINEIVSSLVKFQLDCLKDDEERQKFWDERVQLVNGEEEMA